MSVVPTYNLSTLKKISAFILVICFGLLVALSFAKAPNAAGTFYPDNKEQLAGIIDGFLDSANPEGVNADVFALILPHAGYGFSGKTASFGYKLIKGKNYKTVIIIGPSHYFGFIGVSVYPQGVFQTPLGNLEIDSEIAKKLLNKDSDIIFEPAAFEKEHSIEVQLPFLQRALSDFKIVPIVTGDCTFSVCRKLAGLLKEAIGGRKDVLVIASTDMYHGYDYQEAEIVDSLTLSYLEKMDAEGLYYGLRENKLQLCGGFAGVTLLSLAKDSGYNKLGILDYTTSAKVSGEKTKGAWSVGYSSSVIYKQNVKQAKGEGPMLNKAQKKRLLEIARNSIKTYLKTGKKSDVNESDPQLLVAAGAFVTLHERGELRGCIGSLIGSKPLYLTIRDMAVESSVDDPRFLALKLNELDNIDIEISVLSPLEKIDSIERIQLGVHGVLIRKGFNSGVFLPQVAAETKWTKEEFLSNLCVHKAGLPADAWKDKSTDIYIFSALVFSEKELLSEKGN